MLNLSCPGITLSVERCPWIAANRHAISEETRFEIHSDRRLLAAGHHKYYA
jgi:hypothetical protein